MTENPQTPDLTITPAFAHGARLSLGICDSAKGGGEILALRELIEMLDVRGITITADALHCQRETCELIVQEGGDYCLQLKGTCYLQHAPVTEHFPPLTHDLSILYDRASIEAYRKAARRCDTGFDEETIALLPPFNEAFRSPEAGTAPYQIGICLSFLPNMTTLEELIMSLSGRGDVAAIRLRRHPRCQHDWSAITALPKVKLRPQGEAARDFFAKADITLVPNSGVAIEALHYGCPTFFMPGADPFPDDYYGFVAKGLLPVFSVESLNVPTAFFDAVWQERFLYHDETMVADISALQQKVQSSFMKIYRDTDRARNSARL